MRSHALALTMTAILIVGVAASASGQQRTAAAPAATLDDVLNELRALRTELKESSAANLRAQLLVARLQLQEQRISNVWRQLSEVNGQIESNENGRAGPEQMLKMMGIEPGAEPPKAMAPMLEMFKNQAAATEKADAELKQRQAELLQLMADEQSRWTTFNAQLEALEKAIAVLTPRR